MWVFHIRYIRRQFLLNNMLFLKKLFGKIYWLKLFGKITLFAWLHHPCYNPSLEETILLQVRLSLQEMTCLNNVIFSRDGFQGWYTWIHYRVHHFNTHMMPSHPTFQKRSSKNKKNVWENNIFYKTHLFKRRIKKKKKFPNFFLTILWWPQK